MALAVAMSFISQILHLVSLFFYFQEKVNERKFLYHYQPNATRSQNSGQSVFGHVHFMFVSSVGHMMANGTCENASALTLPAVTLQTVAEREALATLGALVPWLHGHP